MKHRILTALCGTAMIFGMASCSEKQTVYTVEKRDFYYSFDNGATYGNERVDLEVGKTILMKVLITVTTNKEEKESVGGSLSIPNITAIDAYYLRGQKITPTVDAINNVTTYGFSISTNEDWTFIFEFSPAAEARVQMTLDFDDPIPEMYDSIYTIKFVKPTSSDPEPGTGDSSSSSPSTEA